jgi:hypothetical protein
MLRRHLATFFLSVGLVFLLGCGGGSTPQQNQTPGAGSVFVVGTDAPVASVLAFKITLTGLTVSDGTTTYSLLSQPQEVEFARLNGLRTLLALQSSVPAANYSSATLTLATPVISVLDTTTPPPSVQTINGTLVQSTVTVQLRQPLVVTNGTLIGLHLDFRLRDSLLVDAAGQITGQVDPHIFIRAIPPDAPDAEIDEIRGGVVSVDQAAGSFVMQGPHARNLTVVTDSQTQFEPGEDLSTLDTNSVVQVSGVLQRATLALRATEVQVVSRSRFFLGGLITDVRPPSGPANAIDLLVRTELPDLVNVQIGRISTVPLDGNEIYRIHHFRLPIAGLLFNESAMIPGQRVTVGGTLDTTTNPPTPDARRIILHRQGLEGGWVPGSTNVISGNNGSFDFRVTGITGLLFGQPVPVLTSNMTRFINLAGLGALSGTNPIRLRVLGLVLHSPTRNAPVVVAFAVEQLP